MLNNVTMNKKRSNTTFPESKPPFCDEYPVDCSFEMKGYPTGATVHNDDTDINYLIFCRSGHVRITSTLFHDEILCTGEVMFLPRASECSGTVLSDVTLLVHKFNNTVCRTEKCILSYLYSHRHTGSKRYCSKLTVPNSMRALVNSVATYIMDKTDDPELWKLKHKELIWVFTRYYAAEELRSFFHPIINEQVPFKSLVMTHYRKANYTEELAGLCGYGIHTFRRVFKKEFGIPVYRWLIMKRTEHIRYRLSQTSIPLADIIEEFNFSSPQQFNSFCKQYLGDTPGNLRKSVQTPPGQASH